MAVLAVAAILVALALPSFRGTVARARAAETAAALQASLELARAEAIRLNLPVTVCRSVDASLAMPGCSDSSGGGYAGQDWAAGWVVFANTGGSEVARIDDGDQILQRHAGLSTGRATRAFALSSATVQFFVYSGDGLRDAGGPMAITFSIDYRDPAVSAASLALRCVAVNVTGRASSHLPAAGAVAAMPAC